MLLTGVVVVAVLWAAVAATVLSLCVVAARADRMQRSAPARSRRTRRFATRLVA